MSEEIARPYDRAVASRGLSGRGRAMSYNVFDAMAHGWPGWTMGWTSAIGCARPCSNRHCSVTCQKRFSQHRQAPW